MNRRHLSLACFGVAASLFWFAAGASATTSISVNLQVGEPYRGPSIVFRHEPEIVVVPETRVYYVRNCDYDLYRYGSYWYYCYDGGWYRARAARGPFTFIGHRSVPKAVYTVPVKYRRHWREFPGRGHAYGHAKQERREAHQEAHRDARREARRDAARDVAQNERNEGKHRGK